MNQENIEIFKLKKQITAKEEEFKRERQTLQQKVELLTAEVSDYQEKQMKNRQLNESIILSYRQNQSFREQYNQKQMEQIQTRYQQEVARLKEKHRAQKKKMEEEISNLKSQNERLNILIERTALENEKQIQELRNDWQEKILSKEEDMNIIFNHKLTLLADKLKQSEDMCKILREHSEMRASKSYQTQNVNKACTVKTQQEIEMQQEKEQKFNKPCQNVSALHARINRALSQINPNSMKIQHKIRQLGVKYF